MCQALQISRSTYYYEAKQKIDSIPIVSDIVDIFKSSRNNYGTRKIKVKLKKRGHLVSRRRIKKQEGLVSNYTTAKFKPHVDKCNESKIENLVKRKFNGQAYLNVVVSDLT